ncbi:phytanoyl-CoA dioxygenase family protein [Coniochaeta ligniaria NRRL 30616]|uniref:Phytanoyl-CoA dioxygenase family protein n=1 Tax=Coniochaeta ligniaria NRRL 30616 TaxID=1408157 RepID=A0A1J7INA5_9PEZI|nr:phytanoyl-CoA dioxygenase family protein [Coniochaeta ligniaria NRRL 30616]
MGHTHHLSSGLTPAQLSQFKQDGYLILPDVLSPETVQSLLTETHRLLHDELDLSTHPLTKFSTGGADDREHVGDAYFLGSGDKIRFFLEEDAVDGEGKVTRPKERAVNKIGHFLHALSAPFARVSAAQEGEDEGRLSPAGVARSLGYRDPRVLQSMVILKQPEIGGAVPPHQDSCFLYTDPPSAVGFWYALEDATLENGCLSFLPGSHRWAPVEKRLVRRRTGVSDEEAGGTEMVGNEGPRFPPGEEYGEDKKGEEEGEYVAGEVKAGTLVLIHGNLLHKSERNTSQKGRIIYTFHIIEQEGTVYDGKNWLQPPEDGFTKLYA